MTMGRNNKTKMAIGLSADGNHMVNPNHKCTSCGRRMPLPAMNGKYCPDCGTQCSDTSIVGALQPKKTGNPCPDCGEENQVGTFCTGCGKKLK